ncbi:hypothetical protein ACQY0O_004541 [Thecaphora frezii]
MTTSGNFKVGDRVHFTIGQHDEEGTIQKIFLNSSHDEMAEIVFEKQDGTFGTMNRKLELLTKIAR